MVGSRWACSSLVAFSVACGAQPAPVRRSAPVDEAAQLAAMLPGRMDRCVTARPGLVADRRRSIVLLNSWAEPLAWARDLRLSAYASAQALDADGRLARRTYLRFAEPLTPALQEAVRTLPVRWADEECEGAVCRRPEARWVDRRTVRIARHRWPERRLRVRREQCVRASYDHLGAIEVGVGLGQTPVRADPFVHNRGAGPRYATRILFADRRSLSTRRLLSFDSGFDAELFAESIRRHRVDLEGYLVPMPHETTALRVRDDVVDHVVGQRWEELELALEDERLRRGAIAFQRQRREPVPVDSVRVENLSAARHQIQLRQARLAHLAGAPRRGAAAELVRLLERTIEHHPEESTLAQLLFRLALDELHEPDRAARAVETYIASRPRSDTERWRVLRREALAQIGAERLARALVEDRVAPPARATTAAQDLEILTRAGVPYEWAEGAWTSSRDMLRAAPRVTPVRAELSFDGAITGLVGLAQVLTTFSPVGVRIAVRTSSAGRVRAIGASSPEVVAVRGESGDMVLVAASAGAELDAIRRLNAVLAQAVGVGPVTIAIQFDTPAGAGERFVVRGERTRRTLRVSGISALLASARWELVERYLAGPLGRLPTALFPPPELSVRAEGPQAAAALTRRIDSVAPGVCSAEASIVRCRSPGQAERLSRVALEMFRWRIRAEDL